MSAITLGELQDETLSFLSVGTGGTFDKVDLTSFINNALSEHSMSANWWWFQAYEDVEVSDTKPEILYTELDRNVRKIIRVSLDCKPGYETLSPDSSEDMDYQQRYSGRPRSYISEFQTIRLAPRPNGEYFVRVWYQFSPNRLVENTDSSDVPYQYASVVILRAAANACAAFNNIEQAAFILTLYRQSLSNILKSEEATQVDVPQTTIHNTNNPLSNNPGGFGGGYGY